MEQVETKVDVLAVVDATIKLAQEGYIPEHYEVVELERSRAAIAELIEQQKRDAQLVPVLLSYITDYVPVRDQARMVAEIAARGLHRHNEQRAAALARVGGGK